MAPTNNTPEQPKQQQVVETGKKSLQELHKELKDTLVLIDMRGAAFNEEKNLRAWEKIVDARLDAINKDLTQNVDSAYAKIETLIKDIAPLKKIAQGPGAEMLENRQRMGLERQYNDKVNTYTIVVPYKNFACRQPRIGAGASYTWERTPEGFKYTITLKPGVTSAKFTAVNRENRWETVDLTAGLDVKFNTTLNDLAAAPAPNADSQFAVAPETQNFTAAEYMAEMNKLTAEFNKDFSAVKNTSRAAEATPLLEAVMAKYNAMLPAIQKRRPENVFLGNRDTNYVRETTRVITQSGYTIIGLFDEVNFKFNYQAEEPLKVADSAEYSKRLEGVRGELEGDIKALGSRSRSEMEQLLPPLFAKYETKIANLSTAVPTDVQKEALLAINPEMFDTYDGFKAVVGFAEGKFTLAFNEINNEKVDAQTTLENKCLALNKLAAAFNTSEPFRVSGVKNQTQAAYDAQVNDFVKSITGDDARTENYIGLYLDENGKLMESEAWGVNDEVDIGVADFGGLIKNNPLEALRLLAEKGWTDSIESSVAKDRKTSAQREHAEYHAEREFTKEEMEGMLKTVKTGLDVWREAWQAKLDGGFKDATGPVNAMNVEVKNLLRMPGAKEKLQSIVDAEKPVVSFDFKKEVTFVFRPDVPDVSFVEKDRVVTPEEQKILEEREKNRNTAFDPEVLANLTPEEWARDYSN